MDTFKTAIFSLVDIINGIGEIPSINIDISKTKYTPEFSTVIDFNWFNLYKPYTDLIITGFVYISFLWRMFIHLPSIINGTGGVIETIDKHIDSK